MTIYAVRPHTPDGDAAAARAARPRHGGRVTFENVGKAFDTPGGQVSALRGIGFTVEPGEIFGVIGRSGAGKSTLIRTVNGLEKPTAGRVLVENAAGERADVGSLSIGELARLRRDIGMIFQHFNLLSSKTVERNVGLPLRLAGASRAEEAGRVAELLALVGLSDKRGRYPRELSGGQKQRVGIARALARHPAILLCDEATSALDPETTLSILDLLKDINRRLGLTVILITHEMEAIRHICDRVAVIEKGEIVEIGPVWQVFGDPREEATRALLKPHADELPDDLSGRIVPLPGERTVPVFAVTYTGAEAGEPDLGGLFGVLGEGARLLHGSLDRIQGHAQGRLLIAAPAVAPQQAAQALARLNTLPPRAEIIGYVDGAL
ncbi:D-methionine transport system ATP-binding protein [Pseudochelatococcus lubricantis]|uniref:D-methionine transport system ATP-binding protein n=1 Tax=Pseudochelatococcus lubricantis TaxID=1538102 RepID=A0ABX0V208_9HYPH|nr:ATP-binding cassette domain-containing protein [Pseudochelatococcus lubricantis]NIJ58977.1 D-methionine transport system ATP-binding protein [Pseudochelatococcus lubricantis]